MSWLGNAIRILNTERTEDTKVAKERKGRLLICILNH
jgi:hypothetical protein